MILDLGSLWLFEDLRHLVFQFLILELNIL